MKTSRKPVLSHALLLSALLVTGAVARRASADPLHVKDVSLASIGDGRAEVVVTTTGAPQFAARVDSGGMRLVIDVQGADVAGAPGAITRGNALVGGVMTQAFQQAGAVTTRVIVQLVHQAEYRVATEPGGLRIVLAAAAKTGPMARVPVPAAAQAAPGSVAPAAGGTGVTDVRFDHQPGMDRVIIDLSGSTDFTEANEAGHTLIELRGARLPDALQRKLDTTAYGGPVRGVSTYRRTSDPSHVVIDVEKSGESHGAVRREGQSLVLAVSNGALPAVFTGIASDGGIARKSRTVAREPDYAAGEPRIESTFHASAGARESTVEPDQANAFLPTIAGQQHRYTGRRIDIDLKDADIHNVLRLLADVGAREHRHGRRRERHHHHPHAQRAVGPGARRRPAGQGPRHGAHGQPDPRRAPRRSCNKERELASRSGSRSSSSTPARDAAHPRQLRRTPTSCSERAKELLSPRGSIAVDERTNVLIARDIAGNLNHIEELVRVARHADRRRCSSRRASSRRRATTRATSASSGAAT